MGVKSTQCPGHAEVAESVVVSVGFAVGHNQCRPTNGVLRGGRHDIGQMGTVIHQRAEGGRLREFVITEDDGDPSAIRQLDKIRQRGVQ